MAVRTLEAHRESRSDRDHGGVRQGCQYPQDGRLVKELGVEGIDKSALSRITKELDERVAAFRNRTLDGLYPYLWLDATYIKVREGGRVANMAMVIAVAVRADGGLRDPGVRYWGK